MPPDQRGEPLGHHGGRHPLGPRRVLGPAAGRRQGARGARRRGAGRRAAGPGPGGPIPRRCSAVAPWGSSRQGSATSACRTPCRRQAHWRRSGHRAQSRTRRRADGGPEVEHGLVELPGLRRPARAGRPGPSASRSGSGAPATARARTRTPLVSTAATSSPKAKVRTARAVYGPTPGRARSAASSCGTTPAVVGHHGRRRPVQVQRPPVVAQPRPQADHRRRSRRGAGRRRGEGGQEALVVRHDAVDLGLLQHDLGDEDRPGVTGVPPGQVAPVLLAPLQQAAPEAPDPVGLERRGPQSQTSSP